jgi:hypothetical protein
MEASNFLIIGPVVVHSAEGNNNSAPQNVGIDER